MITKCPGRETEHMKLKLIYHKFWRWYHEKMQYSITPEYRTYENRQYTHHVAKGMKHERQLKSIYTARNARSVGLKVLK